MVTINDLMSGNTPLAISHEVLMLLRWLVEHHAEELTKLTRRALYDGLHDTLLHMYQGEQIHSIEEAYADATHFFKLIEEILIKELDEHRAYQSQAKNLQETVNRIDSTLCDVRIVQSSIAQTSAHIKKNPDNSPKELLYKELLRQWRPRKSNLIN